MVTTEFNKYDTINSHFSINLEPVPHEFNKFYQYAYNITGAPDGWGYCGPLVDQPLPQDLGLHSLIK